MPRIGEISAQATGILLPPRAGDGVCEICFNFTRGYRRCYSCMAALRGSEGGQPIDAVAPISYSVGGEQLHHLLADYKRCEGLVAQRATRILTALLWRFVEEHEGCLLQRLGVPCFDVVTTVPSGDTRRDEHHPLRRIVGELVGPTRSRHIRLLHRTDRESPVRQFDPGRYAAVQPLTGKRVLLIDDTWTSGASARSAAAALKMAGAENVAAVVIGRHVNRSWNENDHRLRTLAGSFTWTRCALGCSCTHRQAERTGEAA